MKTCPLKVTASVLAHEFGRKRAPSEKELKEVTYGISLCEKDDCQWWVKNRSGEEQCAFVILAKTLDLIYKDFLPNILIAGKK